MPKYRLLCGRTTDELVTEAQFHPFSVVSAEHVLIYTDKSVRCDGVGPATDETMAGMNNVERAWLRDSITETCIRNGNEQKATENDKAFMEAFERELAAEKERLNGKAVSMDGRAK